ncbi:ABC transporter ATP-binding protein [Scopulibacillus cellulosilyticus]|uniref:ABC transporter ATP-binding protein n=1 Tax=Scopulibacillus cellulosilyticus TaxID=2665665 RepID=A0ABW2PTE9_9BACL
MVNSSVLSVQQVSKQFGKKQVLTNISFTIKKPEIFGLLGPSGAGKSTLVKMIAGIEKSSEGDIYLFDKRMPKLSLMEKIGYMAQADALYEDLTAKENLLFFAAIYGIGRKKSKERIKTVMETVGLSNDLNKIVRQYSGGMKRRLSLAIALLAEPKLLILDEPTVGIDPVLRYQIWNQFQTLKEAGTIILVTTHVMDEAERCDRLGMIRTGRLIATGTPEQLKSETNQDTIEKAFLFYGGAAHAH